MLFSILTFGQNGLVTTGLKGYYDVGVSGGYSGTTISNLAPSNEANKPGNITLSGASVSSNGIYFDGVNDYASFSDMLYRSGRTLSFWMKPTANGVNFDLFGSTTVSTEKNLEYRDGGSTASFFAETDSNCNYFSSASFPEFYNQWNMVTVVFNNNKATWYINGTSVGAVSDYGYSNCTTTVATELLTDFPITTIGHTDIGYSNWYEGYLDKILIYDRALTADEVYANYGAVNLSYTNLNKNYGDADFDLRVTSSSPVYSPSINPNNAFWNASTVYGGDSFVENTTDSTTVSGLHFTSWIDSPQAWSAQTNDTNQYLTLSLSDQEWIYGIQTQGRYNSNQWVTSADIQYSINGTSWTTIKSNVTLNSDRNTKVNIIFDSPILAKYIKIIPLTWNNHISMRFGLFYDSQTVSYTSADSSIISISGQRATIEAGGTVVITATQSSTSKYPSKTTTFTINVSPIPANLSIVSNDNSIFENDLGKYITATSSSTASITYSSSNTSVATIDSATGSLTMVGAGTTLITAVQVSNSSYNSDTATLTIEVNPSEVTDLYTDLNGFWDLTSSETKLGVVDHNMIGFQYNGANYSTGVDDAALTNNGISFTAATYRALPINQIEYPSNNTTLYQTFGGYLDGQNTSTNKSYYENTLGINVTYPSYAEIASFLTEGKQGLGMRGLANIPSNEPLEFSINSIDPNYINDEIPDILITTIAHPASGKEDYIYVVDSNGNQVAGTTTITVIFSNERTLANYESDRFKVNGAATGQGSLRIQSKAIRLSDLGVTSSNYSSVDKIVVHLASGDSDPAFVAYYQPTFSISSALSITQDASQYQHNVTVSPTITVQIKDDDGANVNQSGFLIAATILSGSATMTGQITATTNSSGLASFDNLKLEGSEDVVLQFTASGLDTVTSTLSFAKKNPTISFSDITKEYLDPNFNLSAASSSTGSFTYSSSNSSIASVSGASVTVKEIGSTILTATQAADDIYNSYTVTATLTVEKRTPSYTVSSVTATYGANDIILSADQINFNNDEHNLYNLVVSSSNTDVATIATSGTGVYRQNIIQFLNAGSSIITLSHPESQNYKAGTVTLSVSVNKATPVFEPLTEAFLYGETNENGSISLSTPNGELITEVVFASYGTPTGSAGDYSIGSCHASNSVSKVEAVALGNSSFSIQAKNAVFGDPCSGTAKRLFVKVKYVPLGGTLDHETKNFGDSDFIKTAQTASDGAISFSSSNTNVISIASVSNSGRKYTATHQINGAGAAVITASQAATSNYNEATTTYTITVNKATPTLSLADVFKSFNDVDFNLSLTTNSTGDITYSLSDPSVATISGTTVTLVGAGSTIITASQTSDSNYNAATVTATLIVNKLTPNLEFDPSSVNREFVQVGSTLKGATSERFGEKVVMSSDGSMIAIGAPFFDGTAGTDTGIVRVYQNSNDSWNLIGSFEGDASNDQLGKSIALSSDGTILAFGTISHSSSSGQVKVYQYANASWNLLGSAIDGGSSERIGWQVALSSDGHTLAYSRNLTTSTPGYITIMRYINSSWSTIGTLSGTANGDYFGYSIDLSTDGTTLAVGSKTSDVNGVDSGKVGVYRYDQSSWSQLGSDIEGISSGSLAGASVSLSANGTKVAIGSTGYSSYRGLVSVYEYSNSVWQQLGGNIIGLTSDQLGKQVSLSNDGSELIVSELKGHSSDYGSVKKYIYDSGWNQVGSTIYGDVTNDYFGAALDSSADGDIILAGTLYNDDNATNSGLVKVYQQINTLEKSFGDSDFTLTSSSNSTGTITYSSSDSTIATISGSSVSIVGTGTVTITATQASTSNYNSVSKELILTVNRGQTGLTITDGSNILYKSAVENPLLYVNANHLESYDPNSTTNTWTDLSTNANDGIMSNVLFDIETSAFDFNGTSSYVTLPAILDYGEDTFTIEAYFKSDVTNVNAAIFDQNHSSNVSGRRACLLLTNGSKIGYIGQSYDLKNVSSYAANQWYHVIITVDGTLASNQVKIYKNGVLEDQGLSTANKINIGTGYGASIGRRSSDGREDYNGEVMFVRIYDKPLTDEEVSLNFDSTNNNINVKKGDQIQLSATTSSTGSITYTSSDTSVATVSGTTISFIASGSVVISGQRAEDSNYSSKSFTLPFIVGAPDTPEISIQPSTSNQYLQPNTTAITLSVATESTSGVSYQWYKSETASNTGGTLISGATSSSYTPNTSVEGDLYYYVVVTRTYSTTSNVSGRVRVQPDALEVSYDFSNTDSYGGSGTTVNDLSGNSSRNATLYGNYSFANQEMTLQADNSTYIATPQIPYTGNSNQSFTIIAEVTPLGSSGNIVEMSNTNNAAGAGWNMPPIASANNNFYGEIYSNSDLKYSNYYTGTKYLLMLIFDASTKTQKLYVNGVLVDSQSNISYSASGSNNYFFLGQYNSGCCHTFEGYNSGNWYGKYHKFEVYSKALDSNDISEIIGRIDPNLSISPILATYGDPQVLLTATSSSTGEITYSSSDSNIATVSGTTLTIVGAGNAIITATQSETTNYNSATVTASLTVAKDDPVLVGLSAMSKTFNDADFNISATSSSTGTITYSSSDSTVATISGTTVTIVGAGNAIITASQAADSNYNSATVTASLTVAKDDPVLSGLVAMSKRFNDADFSISATSSSTGTITYSSNDSSVATIRGTTVTIVGAGNTIITATQSETTNYNSATVTASLTVAKVDPVLVGLSAMSKGFNDADFSISATSSSTGAITYSSSDASIATISGTTVSIVGAGNAIITASQAADSNYNSATVTASLTVAKDDPVLIGLAAMTKTFNDADFSISATSSSTGTITYSSSDSTVATISGTTVTIVGAGTAIITASQAADSNYNSATVTTSLKVAKDDPVLSGLSAMTKTFNDADFNISATSSSTGTITYSSSDSTVATISGTTVTIVGAGSTVITASQSSDLNFNSARISADLTVQKDSPILSTSDVEKSFSSNDFVIDSSIVSSTSPGSLSYSSSDTSVATISGTTVMIQGGGSAIISVVQAATANYTSVSASFSLTVAKIEPTISFKDLSKTYGDADFDLNPTTNSTGALTFSSSDTDVATISGSRVTIFGTGSTTITLNQASDTNYLNARTSMVLSVQKKQLTVSGIKAETKIYDGTTLAEVDTSSVELNGLVRGDQLSISVSGIFDTADVGSSKEVSLTSTYSGTSLVNYSIIDQLSTTASITQKTIQLTGLTKVNKIYDGTTSIPSTSIGYGTLAGVLSGDVVTVVGSPKFDSSEVGEREVLKGSVDISGANASNYKLSWTNGSGIITKKTLYVVANNDAKFVTLSDESNYRGVTFSGFVPGESKEDLSGTLEIIRTNSDVELAAVYSGVLQPSGYTSNNYAFEYLNGTYTIVPADQLLIEIDVTDTTYSQTPDYQITGSYFNSTTSEVVYLDSPTYDAETKRFTLYDGAGGSASFDISAVTIVGASSKSQRAVSKSGNILAGSYQLIVTNVEIVSDNFSNEITTLGTITVIPKVITPFTTAPSKKYDGTRSIKNLVLGLSGIVDGDDLKASFVGIYDQKDSGTNLGYLIDDIVLGGDDVVSYALSTSAFRGTDGVINKIPLAVTGDSMTKVYDGQVNSTFTQSFDGFIDGEDQTDLTGTVVRTGEGTTATTIGTYSYTLSGYNSLNYSISYSGGSVNISKAAITVSGIKANNKVYDGTTTASVETSSVVFDGLVPGELATATSTATFTTAKVGTDITVVLRTSYTGTTLDNYTITDQPSTKASITKAPLTVTVNSVTSAYLGVPYTNFSVSYDGFVNGETSAVLGGSLNFAGPGTSATSMGIYSVSVSGLTSDNYEITYAPGSLTITDADTDLDGIGDSEDPDIDGDGILNEVDVDINGDGINDNGTDSNGDGINDANDPDIDGDGYSNTNDAFPLDASEWVDTDGDGIGNNSDTDDDNDKQLDVDEIACGSDPLDDTSLSLDTDGDHIPNCVDTDDDGDTVIDTEDAFPLIPEEWLDTDNDGIGNNTDTDDDNDGQLDVDELACNSDPLNSNELALDTDADSIPNCVDTDDDNDGLSDEQEAELGTSPILVDTDNDGVRDQTEVEDQTDPLDSCSLVVNHQIESAGIAAWEQSDCDGDGVNNIYEFSNTTTAREVTIYPLDTDGDGIYDYLDKDDDGDGLWTMYEFVDPNKDGNPEDAPDYDLDGKPDYLDDDDEGDGTPTIEEGADPNGDGNPEDAYDFDNDGIKNYLDSDDDNDGLSSEDELVYGTDIYDVDSDKDGVIDGTEVVDGTNLTDSCSLVYEHQTEDLTIWNQQDCDGDGVINGVESGLDSDNDGILDYLDTDDDGDGLDTNLENASSNSDEAFDSDYDGIPDYLDSNNYTESSTVADDIEIYNAMSPNGDGYNDVFTIRNIEKYPDNELVIFNRWGKEIYRQKGYGTYSRFYNGVDINGQTLPVGTYYYVLRVNTGSKEESFKGFLYINR